MKASPIKSESSTDKCAKCGGLQYTTFADGERASASACECVGECVHCGGETFVFKESEEGYNYAVPCRCQGLSGRIDRFRAAEIPARFAHATIEGYEELGGNQVEIKYELLKLRQEFEPGGFGLLIAGRPGSGKTHLLSALLAYLTLERGLRCRFIDFGDLTTRIKRGYDRGMSENEIIDDLVSFPVLCVDELGKGRASEWEISVLDALVNRRYNAGVSTFFSTNYPLKDTPPDIARGRSAPDSSKLRNPFDPKQVESVIRKAAFQTLEERVGARIYSRICEMCSLRTLEAEDYRQR